MPIPILYNLTLKIDKAIEDDFLNSIKSKFFNEIILQGIIHETQLNKIILDDKDEDVTYSVHFIFPSQESYLNQKLEALGLFLSLMDKDFKGKYVYFGTMMEVIHYINKT